jgi:hypothetical protein
MLTSSVQNKDIIFTGNDDGSPITALTLDMSDAGAATFNSSVASDTFQNASGNLNILSTQSILLKFDSNNDQTNRELNIQSNSSDQLVKITEDGTTTFTGAVTASAGITVTGTVDVSSQVLVGNNDSIFAENNLAFKSSGGAFIDHHTASQSFTFRTTTSSALDTNAFVLTSAGAATFNSGMVVNEGSNDSDFRVESNGNTHMLFVDAGNDHVNIGTSTDLGSALNVSGDITVINASTGPTIEISSNGAGSTSSLIMHESAVSGSPEFGASVAYDGANNIFKIGIGQDVTTERMRIERDTGNVIFNESGNDSDFRVESDGNTHALFVNAGDDGIGMGATSSPVNSSSSEGLFYSIGGSLTVASNTETLQINRNGTSGSNANNIGLYNDGTLRGAIGTLGGQDGLFLQSGASTTALSLASDGAATFSDDINLGDSKRLRMGAGGDLQIYHDGSNSYVADEGTGYLVLMSNGPGIRLNSGTTAEVMIDAVPEGAVSLYHDNSKKIETTSSGVTVTGAVTAQDLTLSDATPTITLTDTSANTEALIFSDGGTGSGALFLSADHNNEQNDSYMSFRVDGTEYVRIASDGTLSTPTSGTNNLRLGSGAGAAIASGGNYNVVLGDNAGAAISTGDGNVAVGFEALLTEDANGTNVAVGFQALRTLNAGFDSHNVAIGSEAGELITSGLQNTLVGGLAGDALTDADFNVAIGYSALTSDELGSRSTAIGYAALNAQLNQSAADSNNTAVGYIAGAAITSGYENTFVGAEAGDGTDDGQGCVAVGFQALSANCGNNNTAIGKKAGRQITGTNNTCVGFEAGETISSGTDNVIVGNGCEPSGSGADIQIVMGSNATGTGNGNFTIGNGATDSNITLGATVITAPSDERMKEEIETSTAGLSFIKDLRPVTYKWKKEKDIPETMDAHVKDSDKRYMNETTNHGFIAQEVKTAIENHSEIKNGFDMWMERDSDGQQRVAPSALVPILTKAIQEQQALIESLTARVKTLEGG